MSAPEAPGLAQTADGEQPQSLAAGTARSPLRDGDFSPIEGYAVLGEGRTVALVALDGSIDWWPFPAIDSPPLCAAVLDPVDGGRFVLAPDGDFRARRRYLKRTNVLETVFSTDDGEVVVTDSLAVGAAGRLPWTELARRVEVRRGRVTMRWELQPGDRFGDAEPWVHWRLGAPVVQTRNHKIGIVADNLGEVQLNRRRAWGSATLEAGQRALLAVVGTDHQPLFMPEPAGIDRRIDATVDAWRRWTVELRSVPRWNDAVVRSALALKTLILENTGAIAAAATTSLPEGIGGQKNWDYRYSWVRDTSFVLDALINLGLHEEVHGAVVWLLRAIERSGLQIFYTLGGDLPGDQAELGAPGYRASRPVRAGNGASGQRQLGVYGDLFDTVARYCSEGHQLDPYTAGTLADLADECCDRWRQPDSGIWELERTAHYTISKIGCWVALDRAARLAAEGQLPARHQERWEHTGAAIADWVNDNCWSETRKSYVSAAGTEDLDAAVLLAARTGFDRGERLASSIEALVGELGRGPLLYRYSGVEREEGAFVACSFWLVEALAHTGQLERATSLMDEMVARTSDVGLLSEMIDPETGQFLGNIPQALSHLALINAAFTLAKAGATDGARAEGKA